MNRIQVTIFLVLSSYGRGWRRVLVCALVRYPDGRHTSSDSAAYRTQGHLFPRSKRRAVLVDDAEEGPGRPRLSAGL